MVSFDTDILVYATSALSDAKVVRARDLIARAMHAGSAILLLQALAEFCDLARKAGVSGVPLWQIEKIIEAWRAVFPVQATDEDDFLAALEHLRAHRRFWDALLWASAKRAGVKHLLSENLPDGFNIQGVMFVNPFDAKNDRLIDDILPRL